MCYDETMYRAYNGLSGNVSLGDLIRNKLKHSKENVPVNKTMNEIVARYDRDHDNRIESQIVEAIGKNFHQRETHYNSIDRTVRNNKNCRCNKTLPEAQCTFCRVVSYVAGSMGLFSIGSVWHIPESRKNDSFFRRITLEGCDLMNYDDDEDYRTSSDPKRWESFHDVMPGTYIIVGNAVSNSRPRDRFNTTNRIRFKNDETFQLTLFKTCELLLRAVDPDHSLNRFFTASVPIPAHDLTEESIKFIIDYVSYSIDWRCMVVALSPDGFVGLVDSAMFLLDEL